MLRCSFRPLRPPRPRPVRTLAAVTGMLLVASAGYTVRAGDTLSAIAQRLGVSASALADANGLDDPNRIVAGQVLELPGGGGGGGAGGRVHVVRSGETLSSIARRYGVSVSGLASANGLENPNAVRAGARLSVPGGGGGTVSGAAASSPIGASRAPIGELLGQTAREYGWRADLVKALAWQESGWNNGVVSSVGAVGVMQVLPSTGDFVSRYLVGRRLDLHDPADNVRAGVAFLDYLYDLTGGDVRMTLAGYYQGLASVRRNGVYAETERYVDNVLALRARFR
jgi:LysM repeat protein